MGTRLASPGREIGASEHNWRDANPNPRSRRHGSAFAANAGGPRNALMRTITATSPRLAVRRQHQPPPCLSLVLPVPPAAEPRAVPSHASGNRQRREVFSPQRRPPASNYDCGLSQS